MKRIRFILPIACLLFLLILFLNHSTGTDPDAPSYVVAQSQPAGPFGSEQYDWGGAIPIREGKVWIFTALGRTNHHTFLYDLERRAILGELLNGGAPELVNEDYTRFLCEGSASPITTSWEKFAASINKFLRTPAIKTNRVDTYWLLDFRNDRAKRIGTLSQFPGTGSRWMPAPRFRFGYNVPSNSEEDKSFFVCDLEEGAIRKLEFEGKPVGWWDEHDILIKDSAQDFVLFDVLKQTTSPLFSAGMIEQTLNSLGISRQPGGLGAFPVWNGRGYDFYFMAPQVNRDSGECPLLKASSTSPKLTLFSSNFKFGYLGRLDPTATRYIYNGESGVSGKGGNGAVWLRELTNDTPRLLVPPDNGGQYALPRFYGDSVIYWQNRTLWRVGLDGSNATRLLPPRP